MCKFVSLKPKTWQLLLLALFHLCTCVEIFQKNANMSDESLFFLADRLSKQYATDYINFLKTGEESLELRELNKQLLAHRSNISWAHGFRKATEGDKFLACTVCRTVVRGAARIIRDRNSEWLGIDKGRYVKRLFMGLCGVFNILQQEVCEGYFKEYWPIFEYITQTNQSFDERVFCNRLGIKFCSIPPPTHNWVLTINDGVINAGKSTTQSSSNDFGVKILQITDIHYDPDYKAGAVADCSEPLCCHHIPSNDSSGTKLAGYWGDYHVCDAPLRLIENAFNHMRRTHPSVEYVYFTGDVLSHAGWKMTKADVVEIFTHMDKLMKEKFPGMPIYPCIGNNDVYPSDLSSPSSVPESVSTKWLYSRLYLMWSKYLPSTFESAKETILKGGYYTVSPHMGFRIIALNSNECRLNNVWLYLNSSFAMDQLQWLHDVLLQAEQAQEHVHILSHTPIGSAECWKPWSQEYFRLVERFQHIITGIFYGHTHTNDMSVHYDGLGHATSIGWHGGSVTTFVGRNPSYRVYTAESKTMQIVDHETWTLNLAQANANGSDGNPNWFRLSHFTEDFTTDISPSGVDNLLDAMATKPDLLRKYWRLKFSASEPIMAQGCDENCLKATLCGPIKRPARCRILESKLNQSVLMEAAAQNYATLKALKVTTVFFYTLYLFFVFI